MRLLSLESTPLTLIADKTKDENFNIRSFYLGSARTKSLAKDGKSILMFTSTTIDGKKSRIVPMITDAAIAAPRGDVQYVVTEYGAVNLFGKSLQERVMAMISIAHPDFRDELFFEAKKWGF